MCQCGWLLLLSCFSRVRLCDPRDGSPPGSPVPRILQARTLELVAISFSNAWKWKMKENSLSRIRLFATPWTVAHQASPSVGFSRQEYWSGLPFSSLGALPWPRDQTHVSRIAGRLYCRSHQRIPYTRHRFPQWGKRELYIILIDFKLTCKLILGYYLSREELLNLK